MAMNNFTFNGVDSVSYGLYVSGDKTFNSAEKDYTKVSVPGRNGDLLYFNNRYKNVNLSYRGVVICDYEAHTEEIRSWLLSADGYCRLEDSYHPNEFRMAAFAGPIDFNTYMLNAGETTIMFDCKPERWLKSGEQWLSIETGNRIINNPTKFSAKPIIRVYGYGRFVIGNETVEITNPGESSAYIDIDCEIQDCYEGTINQNKYVIISNNWPVLKPGSNGVTILDSEITKIQIKPRWWTL